MNMFSGEHKIDVYIGGKAISKGPFTAKVYSSSGVIVSDMPPVCMLGKPVTFNSKYQ
jgi:hypothetical protein